MAVEVKISLKNRIDPNLYRKLYEAQDKAIVESMEKLAGFIILQAQEILMDPAILQLWEGKGAVDGTTSTGDTRVYQVGGDVYQKVILSAFNATFGGRKGRRTMQITNDAPLSMEVHQGSLPGEIQEDGLAMQIYNWYARKTGEPLDIDKLRETVNAIVERGIPPLPFLNAAAEMVMEAGVDDYIKSLQKRMRVILGSSLR